MADDTAAYYAAIAMNPTLKFQWFEGVWGSHNEKSTWLPGVKDLVKELWEEEYKGKHITANILTVSKSQNKAKKVYTSARDHKRLKISHISEPPLADAFIEYRDTNVLANEDDKFDVIQYLQDRYDSQPDLARFALDILAVPPYVR